MSLAIFNLNDANIQLGLDKDLLRSSPGYAVLNDNDLMIGELAASNTKLLPRWTNNRFWSQLTTAPLQGSTSQVRHHADIAFAHLEELWKSVSDKATQALFVVPGYYSAENLSLLLGIAKECGIPIQGVVDSSVLVASSMPLRNNILHLDIHLHYITLTRLSNDDGNLSRQSVEVVIETGLATLLDRWSNIIANQLIQTTRFDPMHDAHSEQLLFDLLPGWIKDLSDGNMHPFSIATPNAEHSVTISSESLLRACAPLYSEIVQAIRSEIQTGETSSLVISHLFRGFPGLGDSLKLIPEIEVTEIDESKIIDSANLHRDQLLSPSDSAINHILRLETGEEATSNTLPIGKTPTHLLWQDKAYAIGGGCKLPVDLSKGPLAEGEAACSIYLRNNELFMEKNDKWQLQINGETPDQIQKLCSGDLISLGKNQVTLITVLSHG